MKGVFLAVQSVLAEMSLEENDVSLWLVKEIEVSRFFSEQWGRLSVGLPRLAKETDLVLVIYCMVFWVVTVHETMCSSKVAGTLPEEFWIVLNLRMAVAG